MFTLQIIDIIELCSLSISIISLLYQRHIKQMKYRGLRRHQRSWIYIVKHFLREFGNSKTCLTPFGFPNTGYQQIDGMDISRFRDSGNLSDVTIVVDSKEFYLHKFPLYIHSEYFKGMARESSNKMMTPNHVELKNFPGGSHIFQQVADFCYGKELSMTSDNVCVLRCAAQFLGMTGGSDNLASVTDRQINSLLSSARVMEIGITEFLR